MTFCVWLGPTAPSEQIGGKARSLLSLAAAGLPVPSAVAVTTELFATLRAGGPPLAATLAVPDALEALARAAAALRAADWPAGFADELAGVLSALDGRPEARFVVRSSAAIEDRPGTLGAGLFLSRTNVPAGDVAAALREVLASAVAPGVVAYLARRRLTIDGLGFAALIHPFVPGDAAGTAALDAALEAPGDATAAPEMAVDVHTGDAAAARPTLERALAKLALRHGAVEVEWVASGPTVTFLQLRPYRRGAQGRTPAPASPREWRWDAAHNPLPLSPAQAGLVALVDRTCETGLRQRVSGGYLFYAHGPRTRPAPPAAKSATAALAALKALADARLGQPAPSLEAALADFAAIYEPLFGVVQPAARAARRALADFLSARGIDPATRLPVLLAAVPSAASARTALARAFAQAPDASAAAAAREAYLDRFGDESPCWDVAVPTWRESPATLDRRLHRLGRTAAAPADDWQAAAETIRAALSEPARALWAPLLAEARAAAAAAEDDDALYARAQAHVRRALRAAGARLAAGGVLADADDVFWLPLDRVRADARGEARLTQAARLVSDARRADAAARGAPPSLAQASLVADVPGVVRGRAGAGGIVIGRVRLWRGDEGVLSEGGDASAVVVARTILPTELPLIAAAALVVETGGPLDHVAAQARERGLPAVVGAAGACGAFADGDRVMVDGTAGLVARVD